MYARTGNLSSRCGLHRLLRSNEHYGGGNPLPDATATSSAMLIAARGI